MNRRYIYLGPLFLLLMSLATGARADMFSFMKIYIASEIGGVVMMDGKPVPGVKVVQIVRTSLTEKYTNKMVTDTQGRFHFKAITAYSPIKKVFSQANVDEEMYFYYHSKKYLGWEHGKMNYDENGETDNRRTLTDLSCKLDEKPVENDQPISGPIIGVCVWKR